MMKLTNKDSVIDYLSLIRPHGIKLIEDEENNKYYTCALTLDESVKITNLLITEKQNEYDYRIHVTNF
ncbi:hypothetical protein OX284_016260 [Flavobacterium sp. SUN046]|uniref:hypothetical protein n=1 Tax=Flavobacterium sp. SUN046 TaxID=3002440 RepID=UPI002DBB36F6|nr:hypothetical protein [Flavobacterium sp. SUN046]MEC4050990.1 hypothetical protein [Flavobacterium sp. SUN046]